MRGTHQQTMPNNQHGQPADVAPRRRTARERAVMADPARQGTASGARPAEAARVAEWQATTLLELAELTEPPTPSLPDHASCRACSCEATSTCRSPAAPRGKTAAG